MVLAALNEATWEEVTNGKGHTGQRPHRMRLQLLSTSWKKPEKSTYILSTTAAVKCGFHGYASWQVYSPPTDISTSSCLR